MIFSSVFVRYVLTGPFPSSVVENGYGLAYSIGDKYLRWVITAGSHMKAQEYKEHLRWAAGEVRNMMERAELESADEAKAKL